MGLFSRTKKRLMLSVSNGPKTMDSIPKEIAYLESQRELALRVNRGEFDEIYLAQYWEQHYYDIMPKNAVFEFAMLTLVANAFAIRTAWKVQGEQDAVFNAYLDILGTFTSKHFHVDREDFLSSLREHLVTYEAILGKTSKYFPSTDFEKAVDNYLGCCKHRYSSFPGIGWFRDSYSTAVKSFRKISREFEVDLS